MKKIVLSMGLILMSTTVFSVTSSAAVISPVADDLIMSKSTKELSGYFVGDIYEGMGTKVVSMGMWETISDNPFYVLLDVVNGGPNSLDWSAQIYNVTKGKAVTDWQNFKHNSTSAWSFKINEKPSDGDQIELYLSANSGSGNIYIEF